MIQTELPKSLIGRNRGEHVIESIRLYRFMAKRRFANHMGRQALFLEAAKYCSHKPMNCARCLSSENALRGIVKALRFERWMNICSSVTDTDRTFFHGTSALRRPICVEIFSGSIDSVRLSFLVRHLRKKGKRRT